LAVFSGDPEARVFAPGSFGLPEEGAAAAVGQRALIPVVSARVLLQSSTLTCPSGSRLVMALESFAPKPARGRSAPGLPLRLKLLTLRFAEGEEISLLHAGSYLRDRLGLKQEAKDLVSLALQALGRPEPGGAIPETLRLRSEDPLASAGRKIVAQQTLKMRANTEGTLEDLDPEFLHDLRVATRRLRSALRLFGEALGRRRAESLRSELAWIGGLLGTVRDLDVFMANLRGQSERLGEAGAIADVLAHELEARRGPAREHLVSALQGRRYACLLERLEAQASAPLAKVLRGTAALTVAAAGPLLIQRAQKRVLKLGRTVTEKTEPPALHRLRILFKRLRYTCEFFRDAFGDDLEPYIRAMVRFQDCLGEHQDAVVAMVRIRDLASNMVVRGLIPQESLLDLGSLLQVQREIAQDRRSKLGELWGQFDRPSVRRVVRKLAAAPGGPSSLPETMRTLLP
jgi:CHAD domain-containing protein